MAIDIDTARRTTARQIPAEALRENREIQEFYLGLEGGLKKSFRDVKHYKRRKRWLS